MEQVWRGGVPIANYDGRWPWPPPYSKNIDAAWTVLEKLSSHPKYCGRVTLDVIIPGPVRVRIESAGSAVIEAWGRTPSEAICRVALKAVMDS
jgi:hypothetical protein